MEAVAVPALQNKGSGILPWTWLLLDSTFPPPSEHEGVVTRRNAAVCEVVSKLFKSFRIAESH